MDKYTRGGEIPPKWLLRCMISELHLARSLILKGMRGQRNKDTIIEYISREIDELVALLRAAK